MADSTDGRLVLRGATIVTVDADNSVLTGDIAIQDGLISSIEARVDDLPGDLTVNLNGMIAMPAFIQTHVHTCQTLWRNLADDMTLMDWLFTRTWPYEAAMTPELIRASVRLSACELLASGTLLINDFGLVNHARHIAESAAGTGLRGVWARILMDDHDGPDALRDDPVDAMADAIKTAAAVAGIDGAAGFSLAPRFAVSCSMRLLEMVRDASRANHIPVHTHCSENDPENELTVRRFGMRPVALYEKLGLLGPMLRLAHCVRIESDEIRALADSGTRVMHCPTTNLKLASGIAPVPAMLAAGIPVSIGADGAPANNNLNMFREMRIASLIQKPLHGPDCMPAWQVIRMATINGAITLGLERETGSLEVGKRADILVLDPSRVGSTPYDEPCPAIVYSMDRDNVMHLLSGGRFVVRNGRCVNMDADSVCDDARRATARLRAASHI